MRNFKLAFLLLLLLQFLPAKTIHVKTSGSDDNSGNSSSQAVRTITYAVESVANNGDTVLVYPGTYTEGKINVWRDNLTIKAQNSGNKPWIDFNHANPSTLRINATGVTIDGVNLRNSGGDHDGGIFVMGSSQVIIKNLTSKNHRAAGIKIRESSDVEVVNCDFVGNGTINADRTLSGPDWPHAILGINSDNVTIDNSRIYRNHGEGVGPYNGCANWTIRNNTVYDNWSINVYIDTDLDNIKVYNNLIYYSGWKDNSGVARDIVDGIKIAKEKTGVSQTVKNIQVYNNVIINCNNGIEVADYGGGIEMTDSFIANNTIVASKEKAVWFWNNTVGSGTSFKNNILNGGQVTFQDSSLSTSHNYTGNPSFVGGNTFSASAYKLQSTSAGVDAGTSISSFNFDYDYNSRTSGSWDIGAFETSASSSGPQAGKTYQIVNRASGYVLDLAGGNTSSGTEIIQWNYYGGSSQKWELVSSHNGSFLLENKKANKVITLQNNSTANGTHIVLGNKNYSFEQSWSIKPVEGSGGYYRLENMANGGKVLCVAGDLTTKGMNMLLWDWWGGSTWGYTQQWELIEVN